jgi:peptide-methionine (R)-S-oxide reductase
MPLRKRRHRRLKLKQHPMNPGPASRREFIRSAALAAVGLTAVNLMPFGGTMFTRKALAATSGTPYEVTHTDAEWHKLLSPEAYNVLREHGTERPFTSPLLKEHRAGRFLCAGCKLALFDAGTKFESGTGWPSFFQPLPDAVATTRDTSLLAERTEVHCRRCGGHLGHVFNDGPQPTGLRYCMNGVALQFQVKKAA